MIKMIIIIILITIIIIIIYNRSFSFEGIMIFALDSGRSTCRMIHAVFGTTPQHRKLGRLFFH